jgi:hypothetical protein
MLARVPDHRGSEAVPQCRLAAVPLTLLATAALAAGCTIEVKADTLPIPFSVAPTPSASAGVPEYVCTAAYRILTEGAVHLAGSLTDSPSAEKRVREAFTDMSGQLTAEAGRTSDIALQRALLAVAGDLTAAAEQDNPKAYVDGGFQTVGQKLDAACEG